MVTKPSGMLVICTAITTMLDLSPYERYYCPPVHPLRAFQDGSHSCVFRASLPVPTVSVCCTVPALLIRYTQWLICSYRSKSRRLVVVDASSSP